MDCAKLTKILPSVQVSIHLNYNWTLYFKCLNNFPIVFKFKLIPCRTAILINLYFLCYRHHVILLVEILEKYWKLLSVHRMLRVLLLLLLLLLRQVFTSSQSQICLSVRFRFVHFFIQPARGGLFTDLTIYLYGGSTADLSKIPPFF